MKKRRPSNKKNFYIIFLAALAASLISSACNLDASPFATSGPSSAWKLEPSETPEPVNFSELEGASLLIVAGERVETAESFYDDLPRFRASFPPHAAAYITWPYPGGDGELVAFNDMRQIQYRFHDSWGGKR